MTPAPLCPICRYDLSATPDGRCPECGTAFSLKQLVEDAAAHRQRQSLPARVGRWTLSLLAVPPTAVILALAIAEKPAGDAPDASIMLLVFLWGLACLETLALGRNARTVSCVPLLCVGCGLGVLLAFWSTFAAPAILAMTVAITAWMAQPSSERPKRMHVAVPLAAAIMLVSGVGWTLHSASRWREGYRATEFSWWSEPWFAPNQYAMSPKHGLFAGCAMLALGVVLLITAVIRRGGGEQVIRRRTYRGRPGH